MKLTCDQELYSEFDRQLPELSVELRSEATLQEQQKLIHIIVQFADYTEKRLLQGDKKSLKKCLMLAEKLYKKGNDALKLAIEHVYLPHLHLEPNDPMRRHVKALLPFCLLRTYILLYEHHNIEK